MKEGWKIYTLGELCEMRRGLTYSKNDEADFSSNVVLRSNNVDLESKKLDFTELKYLKEDFIIPEDRKVQKGSFLICMSNGSKKHLGKVALIDKNYGYAFGGFMGLLVPNNSIVKSEYLWTVLSSQRYADYIKSLSDGAGINNLKYKDIAAFEVPVPPLSEQERIVSYLDAEFAKIDALKANFEQQLQASKDLFQSALKEMLTPKEGWDEKKLEEICKKAQNIKWSNDSGIKRYIDLTSVSRESLSIIDSVEIDYTNAPSRAKQIIKEGDILFATTRPTLRRVCRVSEDFNDQICSTGFCVLRSASEIDFNFLFYNLLTDSFYSYIEPLQTGASYPAVTDSLVKAYPISFPPLPEQERIAARLDSLSSKIKALQENYNKALVLCNDLKQSLLKSIFE